MKENFCHKFTLALAWIKESNLWRGLLKRNTTKGKKTKITAGFNSLQSFIIAFQAQQESSVQHIMVYSQRQLQELTTLLIHEYRNIHRNPLPWFPNMNTAGQTQLLLTEAWRGNDKKNIASLLALGDTLSACPVEITIHTSKGAERWLEKILRNENTYQVRQSLQGCWDNLIIPAWLPPHQAGSD